MPSKTAQLIAFFGVALISIALHRYVYKNLKRVILRDYPKLGARLAKWALALFIVMDSPFIFLFFRPRLHNDLQFITRAIIYPFSIWQAVMILWALILVPFTMWRRREKLGARAVRKGVDRIRKKRSVEQEEDTYEPILEVVTE